MNSLAFKTSKDGSHQYTVRDRANDADYIALFKKIQEQGVYIPFFKRNYLNLVIGEYKYWIMTHDIRESIIINRIPYAPNSEFDHIADKYDSVYSDEIYKQEEQSFAKVYLKGLENKIVLEVGCGTGNLYPYLTQSHYKGCDISYKMLEQFRAKHLDAMLFNCPVNALSLDQKADFAFAAFGVASFLNTQEIRLLRGLVKPDGKIILSYYKNDYSPKTGNNPPVIKQGIPLGTDFGKYEVFYL